MATSAWAEWTKTCKSEDGTYSETASLLYDNKNWSYTQQKYREGKKYTIKFSTLTNLQPPLGGISSLKTEYWVRCPIDFDNFDPFGVKRSAGFGVRIMLPMIGMMGLDYGWGFDDITGRPDANGGQFHFSMGQQF